MSMSSSSIVLNYHKEKQSHLLIVIFNQTMVAWQQVKSHTRILKRPPLASSSCCCCCCRTCPGSGGEPSGVSAFLFRPWGGWPTPHTPNETGSGSSSTWWIQTSVIRSSCLWLCSQMGQLADCKPRFGPLRSRSTQRGLTCSDLLDSVVGVSYSAVTLRENCSYAA